MRFLLFLLVCLFFVSLVTLERPRGISSAPKRRGDPISEVGNLFKPLFDPFRFFFRLGEEGEEKDVEETQVEELKEFLERYGESLQAEVDGKRELRQLEEDSDESLESVAWQTKLREFLFDELDYDNNIPPGYDVPLHDLTIEILSLLAVDVPTSLVDLLAGWSFNWDDPRLRWDPKDYGNLTYLVLDVGTPAIDPESFVPEFAFYPSQEDKAILDYLVTNYYVTFDGTLYLSGTARLQLFCAFEINWFPFDVSDCGFVLARVYPASFESSDASFLISGGKLEKADFVLTSPDTSFEEINFQSAGIAPPILGVDFIMTREPPQYWVRFIIPIALFTYLSFLTFAQDPINSGRVSTGVTTLLSIIALNFVIVGLIPSDTKATFIDIFSFVSIIFTLVTVLESGFVQYLFSKEGQFTPSALIRRPRKRVFEKAPVETPPDFDEESYREKTRWLLEVTHNATLVGYFDAVNPDGINNKIERLHSYRRLARKIDTVFFIALPILYSLFLAIYLPIANTAD